MVDGESKVANSGCGRLAAGGRGTGAQGLIRRRECGRTGGAKTVFRTLGMKRETGEGR